MAQLRGTPVRHSSISASFLLKICSWNDRSCSCSASVLLHVCCVSAPFMLNESAPFLVYFCSQERQHSGVSSAEWRQQRADARTYRCECMGTDFECQQRPVSPFTHSAFACAVFLTGCLIMYSRWGRNDESPSEDPWVVGQYGAAWVRGVQQLENPLGKGYLKVAASP